MTALSSIKLNSRQLKSMMWFPLYQKEWVEEHSNMSPEETSIANLVLDNDLIALRSILESLDLNKRRKVLDKVLVNKTPLLHHIVSSSNKEMLNYLISSGINLGVCNSQGKTAIHLAVRTGQVDILETLLNDSNPRDETDGLSTVELAYDSVAALAATGNLVNLQDQAGLTPILLLAETSTLTTQLFTEMATILLKRGADVKKQHPGTGQNILFRSVELNAIAACNLILETGIRVDHKDYQGNTVLHLAARLGHLEILRLLLQKHRQGVNLKNLNGETPLHSAASAGSRECITILLNFGGDLSAKNNDWETVTDAIFSNISRPSLFLQEILDSKVVPNQYSINGQHFEMTIDFRILTPNKERQMSVIIALMDTIQAMTNKTLLQHPLIDTYLRFKWTRMRIFFFVLVLIHLTFVLSLSCHVIYISNAEDLIGIQWSRRALLIAATLLLGHLIVQTLLAPRYFLYEAETWISITCVLMGFVMSLTGELLPEIDEPKEWILHIASYTVLLAWVQMMFILGRFPTIGYFALMFFTVFKNMLKVLLIFACLVIGFSLSFSVQFNSFVYGGPWKAFLRTVVMLMGEYDFENNFVTEINTRARFSTRSPTLFITSELIFLLFIFLGSMVLVNLLIGLAVSDIQGLQTAGNLRHMIKQAEFLFHMDRILSVSKVFQSRKTIPSIVTINPTTIKKIRESNYRRLGLNIPIPIIEGLVKIALKNQRRESDISASTASLFVTGQPSTWDCECEVNILQ